MTSTFIVRGHKIKSASMRRFIVVRVTTDSWKVEREVEHTDIYGGKFTSREEVVGERGFRVRYATEAEAVAAAAPGEIVTRSSKAGASVEKRSDSVATAKAHASRMGGCVVVDTTTGEEV